MPATTVNETYLLQPQREVLTIGGLTGTTSGTTNTQHFKVWPGAKALTVICPDLATSTALKLQVLTPLDDIDNTQTWVDLNCVLLTDMSLVPMSFADNKAFTLPASALGGGILRFACADTQAGSPLKIYLLWSRDG